MRIPSFPHILRTIYTFSNASARTFPATTGLQPFARATVLRSMPTIPFLGSLFSSNASSSKDMSYPTQKSDDEWRAVLNKGAYAVDPTLPAPSLQAPTRTLESNR